MRSSYDNAAQTKIGSDVEEFLKNGGEIETVHSSVMATKSKQQIDYMAKQAARAGKSGAGPPRIKKARTKY